MHYNLPAALRQGKERFWIVFLLFLYFLVRLWGLPGETVNRLYDEGVHLALMQMLALRKGELYRDFLFIHPPGVIWIGSWLWFKVHGSLFAIRLLGILFSSLVLAPLYVISRKLYGASGALITLALVALSPGFGGWMGRYLMLEQPANVAIYLSLWILLRKDGSGGGAVIAGLLMAADFLIKETAAPAAFAIAIALIYCGGGAFSAVPGTRLQDRIRIALTRNYSWLWFTIGFLSLFIPIFLCLAHIPGYLFDTFKINAEENFFWNLRPYELINGFYQMPLPMTFGAVGVFLMIIRPQSSEERFLGVFALGLDLIMLITPRRFYWRYLLHAMPVFCLGFAAWLARWRARPRSLVIKRIVYSLLCLLILTDLVSFILSFTVEEKYPPGWNVALETLHNQPGPLFTLDPIWSAASHLPLYPWKSACDVVALGQYGDVTASELTNVASKCPTVLLNKLTMQNLPRSTYLYILENYHSTYSFGKPGSTYYVDVLSRNRNSVPLPGSRSAK